MAVTDDMLEIDQSQLAAFHSLLMSPGLNRNLHKQRRRSYRLISTVSSSNGKDVSLHLLLGNRKKSYIGEKGKKKKPLNFSLFVEVIINHRAIYIHNANILVYTQEYLL